MRLKHYISEGSFGITTLKDETGHVHNAMVDANGDGKTVDTKGGDDHEHMIKQWLVQSVKGHIHNLSDM